jgi:hypothetical protein
VSALVTQEIKANYEPHYHDDEEQRKTIRSPILMRLDFATTFRPTLTTLPSFKICFAASSAKLFEMAGSSVLRFHHISDSGHNRRGDASGIRAKK